MSPKCQEVWRKNMFFLDTWILGSQKFAKYPKKRYPRVSKSIYDHPPSDFLDLTSHIEHVYTVKQKTPYLRVGTR